MLVTVVDPECRRLPVDEAKARSPMSTCRVAGSMPTLVKWVRTFVPGEAPPAVYWEKLSSSRSYCRRAATVAHGPETAGDDLQMQFLMSVTHDRATLVSIAAQATRMTLTPTAS